MPGEEQAKASDPRSVVFLCDYTGTMANKIATLKSELGNAIRLLKSPQAFDVLLIQHGRVGEFSATLGTAKLLWVSPQIKRQASAFVDTIGSGIGAKTSPLPSLEASLKPHPQVIFFLTDSAPFPDSKHLTDAIKDLNKDHATMIHTIHWWQMKPSATGRRIQKCY